MITDHKLIDLESLNRYHANLMSNVIDELPQISDDTTSTIDTWSSNKINSELTTLKNNVVTKSDIQSLFGGEN